MISLVIPYGIMDGKEGILKGCLDSMRGMDETIVVANDLKGYGWACNRGLELARGDYLIVANDDTRLINGSLRSLPDALGVTVPLIEPEPRDYKPRCFFCMPRWVYEKIGGFDERFEGGYFEDDDMIKRLADENIPTIINYQVEIHHLNGGGTTLKKMGEQELFNANKKRYEEKWELIL